MQNTSDIGTNTGIKSQNKFTAFPVKVEDFVTPPEMYGLWPFGAKGNTSDSHNEGHPGWDFELKKGSKVYAISDLRIAQIHSSGHASIPNPPQVIEAYTKINNQDFHITYHSVANLEEYVKEEAIVKAGQVLAEAGYPLSEDTVMIHFGVFPPNDSVGSCPTPYFADSLQQTISQIVAKSINQETGEPYESACVGKINRNLYEKNFPDRLKYFGGEEQWE